MPLPRRRSRQPLALFAVLAASLAIRLAWALSRSADPTTLAALPDQVEYFSLARNFLHAGTLCFFDPRFGQTVWAYRMPGYPLFIAALGGSLRIVRAVQAILDTSTVLATYLLARRMLAVRNWPLIAGGGSPGCLRPAPPSLAQSGLHRGFRPRLLPGRGVFGPDGQAAAPIWAAAIVGLNPFLIYFSGLILSETLSIAMLAWGMYLLVAEPDRRMPMARASWWAGVLVLGASVLVRPEAAGLAPLLVLAAWAMNRAGPVAYHWGWLSTFVCVAVLGLMLLPWEQRNIRVLGQPVWLTTNGGITLYDGNHVGATGGSNQQSFLADLPQLQSMTETQRNAYFTAKAERFIEQHPGQFIALGFRKLARTWSPMPLSREFGTGWHVAAALAYAGPFDLLVLLGLINRRLRSPAKVFLLMPAIYLSAVHVLTVGSLRYLVPAEAPMAILAAVALPAKGEPGCPQPGQDLQEIA